MLQNAATKIGNWEVNALLNKDKVVGYGVTENTFIKELETMKALAQKAINNSYTPIERTTNDGFKWIANADGSFTQVIQ